MLSSRRAYLYASKLNDKDELLDAILNEQNSIEKKCSIKAIIENIGLDLCNYEDELRKFGFQHQLIDIQSNNQKDKLREFLEYIYRDIHNAIELEKKALMNYFENLGVINKRICIIDIGWRGTSQLALMSLLNCEVFGYYFCLQKKIDRKLEKNVKTFIDELCFSKIKSHYVFSNIMMFEFLFSSPMKSLKHFNIEKGYARPEFIDRGEDKYINSIHKIFLNEYKKNMHQYDFCRYQSNIDLIKYFFFLNIKSKKDRIAFSRVSINIGIGEINPNYPIVNKISISKIKSYKDLSSLYYNSKWKDTLCIEWDVLSFKKIKLFLLYKFRTLIIVDKIIKFAKIIIKRPRKRNISPCPKS